MVATETMLSLGRLLRLTEAIHSGRGLAELLEELIQQAGELPEVDTVRILLTDPTGEVLVAQAGIFPYGEDSEGAQDTETRVPIGAGFAGRIAAQRRPLLVPDLDDFPVYSPALHRAGVRCAVGVPLLAGNELIGVMHIGSRKSGAFAPEAIPLLEAIAERVALTVQSIQSESQMAFSESRFRALFEQAPVGICLVDLQPDHAGRVLRSNASMSAITGLGPQALSRLLLSEVLSPGDPDRIVKATQAMAAGEISDYMAEGRVQRPDGTSMWLCGSATAVREEARPSYAIVYVEDITSRKITERELARRALSDPLTGLANRSRVMDHLTLALRQQPRSGGVVGLLYLDIDHFKDVNDVYGHDAGDRVLQEVARRLEVVVRAGDTAGRIGGDEFIVVCPNLTGSSELASIATRLHSVQTDAIGLHGGSVEVGISIGVAIGDRDTVPEELLRRADVAMYEAKRQGRRRWEAYTPQLDRASQEHDAVEALLRGALDNGWFRLYYQPIVDVSTGSAVGAEALLRIAHPERGLLTPDTFIEHLETAEVGASVERWVLAEACRQMKQWNDTGLQEVSVNVSGRLAASGQLSSTVLAALEEAGLEPHRLCVEMTERIVVEGGPAVLADLERLRNQGVSIAIDDFGTGFASLTYLQRFPVSVMKIDHSFTAGIGASPRDDAIVEAITTLGNALGIAVIAEGVEQQDQADALRRFGCDRVQGFLFGAPCPPELLDLNTSARGNEGKVTQLRRAERA
ncbi:MAG TPA: EAL domain-containing protein [Frankiaceae bacterium]|nr:EAL domain-containing protein [Frankiaceae bacterium]